MMVSALKYLLSLFFYLYFLACALACVVEYLFYIVGLSEADVLLRTFILLRCNQSSEVDKMHVCRGIIGRA